MFGSMGNRSSNAIGRREALSSIAAAAGFSSLAGCATLGSEHPAYQLVAGVERTVLRGTRDETIRKIAETRPVNVSVVDSAPTNLRLQTIAYDDEVVDLSGPGALVLDETTIEQINEGYENPYGVLVLTLYNDDPYNDIPTGNSYGYRVTLDQFNQAKPGDRVTVVVDTDRDIVAIDRILSVETSSD